MHRIESLHDVPVLQRLLAAHCKRARRADRVLDLPSVDRPLPEVAQLLVGHRVCGAHLLKEGTPDLNACVGRELLEVERDVDAREEGFIKSLDAVGGEEEDTTVVLDMAQAVIGSVRNGMNIYL